jgi:hypothetical protein
VFTRPPAGNASGFVQTLHGFRPPMSSHRLTDDVPISLDGSNNLKGSCYGQWGSRTVKGPPQTHDGLGGSQVLSGPP